MSNSPLTRRPRRPDSRHRYDEAVKLLIKPAKCCVDRCANDAEVRGRFCSKHGQRRSRQGAAHAMDVLPLELLEKAASHLVSARGFIETRCPPSSQLGYDELGDLGNLTLDDPIQTVDCTQHQFDSVAKELSYEAQVELFLHHQVRNGRFPSRQELAAKLIAARWCYLLLAEFGMLGSKQSRGWRKVDHDVAWRTVFGNAILKDQQLSKKKIPATVRRMISRRVERLYDIPNQDERFRDLLHVHEFRNQMGAELYEAFQRHQEIYSSAAEE